VRLKIKNILLLTTLLINPNSFLFSQQEVRQWDRVELVLKHTYTGNSFLNVNLAATFSSNDTAYTVAGFYDGDNTFKVRFMPEKVGSWNYVTKCNIPQLNNKKGSFECVKATSDNHGIVRVSDTYNFKYADGKQYFPLGTTAYAWQHMGQQLQETTLQTLKKASFNKIRMCVFPKDYDLVKEEPELYPFSIKEFVKVVKGKEKKVWDFTQFNPAFFQHLEKRIDDLNRIGIEADLILFHPYDKGRWGFDSMSMDVNIRYIKYITARLSSFRNIWWSMANEYDYLKARTHDDWVVLSKAVAALDPYRHLLSIHGSTAKYFEYWLPEFTHISIQDEAPVMNKGAASILRNVYGKPIIYDEVGYEGNLKQRWGRYSGEEMNHLIWMGIIGGTFVTHGESYMFKDDKDTIFWAKGGTFKGTSWKRVEFLKKILEEGNAPLEPADISRDFYTATTGKGSYIIYFGKEINNDWVFNIPAKNAAYERPKQGNRYNVEIIDTWDMTIEKCPLIFEIGAANDYRFYDKEMKKIRLPLKPYLALRVTELPK
jgi:Domain of unknown function (DUF5060)/Protein of unknown function (DUF4038)/Domain of unknown function (DUF5605)